LTNACVALFATPSTVSFPVFRTSQN
jgi:hypothetical protein